MTGEIEKPSWTRREREEPEDYEKFILYYLPLPEKNRSIRNAVEKYLDQHQNEGINFLRELSQWEMSAKRHEWEDRAAKFDIWRNKDITLSELGHLEDFKETGLNITKIGRDTAVNSLMISKKMLEEYYKGLPRKEDGTNDIDFALVKTNDYINLVRAQKTVADYANTMIELSNKMLAIDVLLNDVLDRREKEEETWDV